MKLEKLGLFAAGVLFGSVGIKILCSKDAKKIYTKTTAVALRVKDSVMATVTTLKENAGDILADAKEINEKNAAEEVAIIEDTAEDLAEEDDSSDPVEE